MSRRGMHRDVSYLEVPQETSTMTQNSAVVGRLDYSADEEDSARAVKSTSTSQKSSRTSSRRSSRRSSVTSPSNQEDIQYSTQSSTKARKATSSSNDTTQESTRSTSRSVRSRRPTPVRTTPAMSSASMQSSVQSTPSGVQLHKTFSDSTTRQGTSYSVEWTLDSKGRRRRSTRLARMVGAQDTTDHMGQNDENTRREYEHEFSDKDSRLQYLYGLDGPDYGDGIDSSVAVTYADDEDDFTDDSDNEVYVNDVMREHQEESLVTTTITTIATIITTIFTIIFYIPVKTVEVVSAQFQPDSHTRSHTQTQHTSIYSRLWTSISTITSTVFYIISGVLSWLWWRVGGGAHGAIAQTVQSDVWLLSRTSRLRRRYGCCCLLPLLLLLPFFLASSYYISERGVGLGAFPIFPILAANDSRCCVVQQGTNLTDQELQQKVQAILVGLLADQESRQEQMYADQRKELTAAQLAALATHRGELEKMVHGVLKDELAVFTAAQGEKEREFQRQAQETAEAQAAAAVLVAKSQKQGSEKSAEQYSNIVSQINLMGSKNDGKMDDLSAAIAAVQAKADTLALELEAAKANAQKSTGDSKPSGAAILQLEDQIASLRTDITNLHGAQAALLGRVGECCKNNSALALLIKTAVKDEMALLMGGTSGGGGGWFGGNDGDSRQGGGFMGWLSGRFAAQEDVDAKLAALAARLSDQIEAIPTTNAQGQQQMMYMHDGVELTAEQVRTMIRDALLLYGADKTGQPDYALESAGGSIISTRCSETYHRRTAQLSLFGIPLWYASNSPRSVIQPDVHPGQCWAFKGTQGYLVVQLAGEIYPTAFAMEHIPKALSPTGNIDSAPKDFSVMGLEHDRDTEGVLMGNFTYRDDGEPLQHFTLQEPSSRSFSLIEVRIHTNHGNPEYTCLYRFRVHGNLRRW